MVDPKYARYLTSVFETDFSKPLEGQIREETIQALLDEESSTSYYGEAIRQWELKERVDRGDVLRRDDISNLIAIAYKRVASETGQFDLAQIKEEVFPFIHWEEISDKNQANPIHALVKIPKEERENVYRHARPLIAGLDGYMWEEILGSVSKMFKERKGDSRECSNLSKEEIHEMCTRLLSINWRINEKLKLVLIFKGVTNECYKEEREEFYKAARNYFSRMSCSDGSSHVTWLSFHYPHLIEGEVGKEAFEKLQKLAAKTTLD